MAYFQELDNIINTSINMMLNNQNLCKLLYYYPEETTYQYNPLAQPNIENTSSLLLTHIFPLPKTPDADTNQNCFIDITLNHSPYIAENKGFRRITINFDIICHLDAWIIKNGYRPTKILAEIDEMFNNELTNLPIENKPQFCSFDCKNYSNKFYGYHISYELIINSNVTC